MFQETLHDPLSQSPATMVGVHDDVADPGVSDVIRHAANKANLPPVVEQAEANRVADALFDHVAGSVVRPIGGVQQGANGVEVQASRIIREQVIAVLPLMSGLRSGRFLHEEHTESSDAI